MTINRRDFITRSGLVATGVAMTGLASAINVLHPIQKKGPHDFVIVQGHYDIWEFNDRLGLDKESQNSPLRDFLLPRLLEAGISVVVMPAGGEAARHRIMNDQLLAGSMRSTDMLLREIEKTNGKASVILTKRDVPTAPDPNHVKFFLDFEGGNPLGNDAEPGLHKDQELSLLRNFFRLGVRGLQLIRDGRNQLGDGWLEGDGDKLSRFGIKVVQEMNRLGMLVGVSHVSEKATLHAAEISTKPIVASHSNPRNFTKTLRDPTDEEIKAIAKTGGLTGVRYLGEGTTPYETLATWLDYMVNLTSIDHVGFAWLGHDVGHPKMGYVPGVTQGPAPSGYYERMTKYEQNSRFIDTLYKHKYDDASVAKIMGGNWVRVMREVLPD